MTCHDQIRLVGLSFMACPHSLTSDRGKIYLDPKSGRNLNPEMLGRTTTSCWGGETNPYFCAFFLAFCPDL